MRRSAAPSQIGNAAKKARFIPPFLQKDTRPDSNPLTVIGQLKHQTCGSINSSEWLSAVSQKRNVLSQLQSKQKDDVKVGTYACTSISRTGEARLSASPASCKTPDDSKENDCAEDKTSNGILSQSERIIQHSIKATCKFPLDSLMHPKSAVALKTSELSTLNRRSFKAPVQKKPSDTRTVSHEDSSTVQASYYSVMWCKRSKKKHKKWEGDAVLITKGKSVSLLDMDGKEIGKSSGYKVSELECMEEGQSLLIGGKEIEVLGKIAKEDFHAGKCFQSAITMSSDHRTLPQVSKVSRKAFCNPQKTQTMKTQVPSSAPQPLFDPSSPNVLILPRPSPSHQWQNNNNQSFVVDVVADPYLVCKLRPHQREGVKFLYECVMGMRSFKGHGAILADDMGLGKTLQCITLIWTLLRQGPYNGKPVIKRILVVTPGSLVKNWCYEFNKWLGKERLNAFGVGSDRKIQEFLHSPIYPVMVVSYEMAVRYADDLHKIKFDLMVCDEAHRLKSNTIKTTSILNSLSIKRRILLTGTPIQNDLKEFYSLAEFCNPSILGSESLFHRLYEEPVLRSRQPEATEEEKKIGKMRAVELSRIMALFVLRRTQEVNNKYLPPKVENVIFCKPKPLQLSLYRHLLASRLVRRCLTRGITGDATAPHLICIGALKKLCNHPTLLYESGQKALEESEALTSMDMYGVEKEISLYDGLLPLFPFDYKTEQASPSYSGKLAALAAMLHVLHTFLTQEKIVVVSNYTQTLDILQTFCEAEGYKVSRLDGTTPTAKRQQIVDHFNSKHSKETVFLLSSKAGGVGLNLIGASRLILYDIDWNPANDLQSMARVWRDGQRKQVHIYRLITAGTVEEKVFQRQISKQGLSGAVVDVTDRSEVKFSLEDLKDLFTLHEDVSCLTHDMLNCHCSGDGRTVTEEDSTEVRLCQLGKLAATSGTKKKTVSMAELLKWKHYSYPFQGCSNDDLLKAAGQDITYIFQNETNLSGTAGSAESDV